MRLIISGPGQILKIDKCWIFMQAGSYLYVREYTDVAIAGDI